MTTMTIDTITFTVAQHLAVFFEYGDTSDMSRREIADATDFLESLPGQAPDGFTFMHSTIGESVGFDRDEVSGLMADCVELIAVYRSA